jgi:CRISPR-associated protein Cas5d
VHTTPKNSIQFKLRGRHALFTDPITRIGGEKCSYHLPTYEAIKGVLKSIYWKPTIVWKVDKVRVMKPIRTETKGVKPLNWTGGNTLAYYTYLREVEYQVLAHFEWNESQPHLEKDRNDGKHYNMALRALQAGGRQDIFLGTRECQGYVEAFEEGESFDQGRGAYHDIEELSYGLMFHSFDYPDETGKNELRANFWQATLRLGVLHFDDPDTRLVSKHVRPMTPKTWGLGENVKAVATEDYEDQ